MSIVNSIKDKIKGKNMKIVFPEGEDKRILGAAIKLKNDGLIDPIILGNLQDIKNTALENKFDISDINIIEIENYSDYDKLVDAFVERRKGKATREDALEQLKNVNYFGTMLVYTGKADGLVSGAVHSTGDTVRPALQIIKTKPGVSRTSGAMLMLGKNDEKYIFSDIAINITLEPQELAEVAVESAKTAKIFDIDPKVSPIFSISIFFK